MGFRYRWQVAAGAALQWFFDSGPSASTRLPRFVRIGLLALATAHGAALASERGSPPLQVYEVQPMGAAHLNLGVHQLPDGRLIVANNGGPLEFDGTRWTHNPQTRGGMSAISLAPDGRLFASFDGGDIGWFARDATGNLAWNSLLERLPVNDASGELDIDIDDDVNLSYDVARAGLWVCTLRHVLFIPDDGSAVAVLPVEGPQLFGRLLGTDFVVQQGTSWQLQRVKLSRSDARLSLEAIAGNQHIQGRQLWDAAATGNDHLLLGNGGLLLRYRDGALQPWRDLPSLARADARALARWPDGRLAIGSSLGVTLLDAEGAEVDHYDGDDGVPVQRRLHDLMIDREGDLWLAQDRTVTRIALARGVTIHDQSRGLPSAADAERWRGQLYVAANTGLFRLEADSGPGGGQFVQVLPGIRGPRSIAVLDEDSLLVGFNSVLRVFVAADGKIDARPIADVRQTSVVEASRFVARRAYAAHATGVVRIDLDADDAATVTPVPGANDAYHRLAELDEHTLWLADRRDGVLRVDIHGRQPPRRYAEAEGLPAGQVRIYNGHSGPWFTTNEGLRVFDAASDRFVIPAGLPPELHADRLFAVLEDADTNLWVRGGAIGNDAFWRTRDGWQRDGSVLFEVDPSPTIFGFLREANVLWAIRANGLMRIDLDARQALPPMPAGLLTGIHDLRQRAPLPISALAGLAQAQRDLRFGIALPMLHRPEATLYRTRLLGYDDWSDWGGREAASRTYTNLPDGNFRFQWQARDGFLRESEVTETAVIVTPPWWRQPAALAAYLAAALLLLWLAARFGSRQRKLVMLARQRELEAVVEARTLALRDSNAQLAEQAERLAEVDRLKTRFFINVGHEFRTPLTLVLGPIDDLLRDARERFSARAREQLEMANRNARRVLDLIVEMLDVNRFEHGQMRLNLVATDLHQLAKRVLQDHADLLERHGHRCRLEIPMDAPWVAAVDPPQLARCLSNLIGNAAKYMPRGGAINLRLQRNGGWIELALSDQGRGISAAALPHVFDRFFQTEGSDSASGYGIGLALVREIIEAHQGQVEACSELGVGSTFLLRLPALAADAPALDTAAPPATEFADAPAVTPAAKEAPDGSTLPLPRGRPLLLVVDDHDELRAHLRGLLQDRFEVIESANGPDAWNMARDRLPDLVVCDVMMPGFDGIELTRRLRGDAETAAIALLLLTAKVGSEHAVAGLSAGADDYLAKPFDASELLARIDALLGRAQRLRLRLLRERLPEVAPPAAESADQRWRSRLDGLIRQQLDDPELSVERLANAMHSDRSQLFRKCKELLGVSPSEYLRDTRLRRAHELLEQRVGSISEIAYAVGFDSLSSFTRAFKLRYGMPPSQVAARKAG
jgi:signal transduction histidine kinase/DNA-binding response OmpR family regulator